MAVNLLLMLLWVVQGHAFLGYWRQEMALDAITQSDVSDVVNFIDLGLIRLIETRSRTRVRCGRIQWRTRSAWATHCAMASRHEQ